jgi:hypothetical protein
VAAGAGSGVESVMAAIITNYREHHNTEKKNHWGVKAAVPWLLIVISFLILG